METWLISTFLMAFSGVLVNASGVNFTSNTPFVLDYLTQDLILSCQVARAQDLNSSFVISLTILRYENSSNSTSVLAEVSAYSSATLLDSSLAWTVVGSVKNWGGLMSFLEIRTDHPSQSHVGEYTCEVNLLDENGHTATYSENLVVLTKDVQPKDLATYFVEHDMLLQLENMNLQARKDALEDRILSLEKEKAELQSELLELNRSSSAVQQDIRTLSNQLANQSKLLDSLNNITKDLPNFLPVTTTSTSTTTTSPITTTTSPTTTTTSTTRNPEVHIMLPNPRCTHFPDQNTMINNLLSQGFCNTAMYKTYCRRTCNLDSSHPDIYHHCIDAILAVVCRNDFEYKAMLISVYHMTCTNCALSMMPFPSAESVQEIEKAILGIKGCFPGDSFVLTSSGARKVIEDLNIGDSVLALNRYGQLVFSEVYAFLHENRKQISKFYTLKTEHRAAITLSPEHLVYILDGHLMSPFPTYSQVKLAEDVEVGDTLSVVNFVGVANVTAHGSRIVSKTVSFREGVYAPVTMEGTIVVDKVMASCYAVFPDVNIIEVLFLPLKMIYKLRKLAQTVASIFPEQSGRSLFSGPLLEPGPQTYEMDMDPSDGLHWYTNILMDFLPYIMSVKSFLGM